MANLQVKNVPEALVRKVRSLARRRGRTMRDLILDAVRREIDREQWRARLEERTPVEIDDVARVLEDARADRDRALDR